MKGYKGFDKDLKCRDFQFEVGKEYKHDGGIGVCASGFHYCENPLDVLDYYNLCDCEFCEVEALGKIKTDDKKEKSVTDHIRIGAKLDLSGFIKASFDFLFEKCKRKSADDDKCLAASGYSSQLAASGYSSKLAASGKYSKLAASGNSSQLAASGYYSKLAASGYYSKLAASGNYSQLAASGDSSKLAASGNYSQLAASGNSSQLAASGDSSQLAASGDSSQLAASGYYSKLAASGYYSQLEMTGSDSVGANIGIGGTIKAAKGCWITLAEYDANNKPICVVSAKVDGKKIKADTWYALKKGKFVKVKQ